MLFEVRLWARETFNCEGRQDIAKCAKNFFASFASLGVLRGKEPSRFEPRACEQFLAVFYDSMGNLAVKSFQPAGGLVEGLIALAEGEAYLLRAIPRITIET